ncbi:major facilitator superfamily domain-containing protein [Lentinula edodes]|uniref:Major facilitator superfamily domain-containing protein n=1 Tax=Lentinula lateritia TaxID=40482 RepID=A0A9W8ZQT9_9AGAR|nr:major facilitator superfamily domain-containing protein [Lentinula edodes]
MSSSDAESIKKLHEVDTVLADDLTASDELLKTIDLAEEDAPFKLSSWLFSRWSSKPQLNEDDIATRRSVYDNPEMAQLYWPKQEYENLHRFDPTARWTHREERSLVRKIDWKIMAWAALSFSALNLDRNNLSQANTDNFLPDLDLTTDDFNWGNSIFRLAFLCAELPSQLVSKRLGPDRWIPTQMVLWSIVTLCQFWLTGRTSFFLTRALLGFIQGGFIPDLILYLSYFYTKNELPFRLALFWMSSNLCSIVGSFIAFGVLRMRGVLGRAGWRWLFLVEGLITFSIGVATFFRMPPSPTQSRTWFRPKGWFTEREETIMVTRVLRDDPTKGDMHNREGLSLKRLWTAVCDYDLWPLYLLGLMFGIPGAPPSTYLTLSLRNLGFSTFTTNLLTIPSTVAGMITMFAITMVSEVLNERTFVAMNEDLWVLPFLVALYCLPENPNQWIYFGLASGLLSYPYTHPIQVGWCSRNAGAVASRTVNASIYNMFVQATSVISAQIYRADDAPRYRRGNLTLIIICCFNVVVLYPATKAYYIWRNRQRDRIWDAMSVEERKEYLTTTTDVGNRRLDFRFAH